MARGGDEEIFRKNLTLLEGAAASLAVIRTGVYHEAAVFAKQKYGTLTPDEIAGIYRAQFGNTPVVLVSPDFARFCEEFTDAGSFGFIDTYADDDENPVDTARIAYMQNTFSDRAYRIFERVFERVAANYYPGFREVCEEVYYGRCTHAMLPVSSARDGILASFRKLIEKYELKIVSETDVDTGDDSGMRFALLRRGLNMPSHRNYCDLTVVLTSGFTPGAFLTACEIIGASAVSVNTYPLEYADDRCGIQITLDISRTDPETLYLFLEGSHVSYEVIGLYDLLSSH